MLIKKKYHNIYIGEVGKWCPFEDDPEKAKDAVYKDEELNRLMKGYKENQEKAKEHFHQRKAEMVAKALADTKDKKEKFCFCWCYGCFRRHQRFTG